MTDRKLTFPRSGRGFSVEVDVVALINIRVTFSPTGAVTGVIGLFENRGSDVGVSEFVFNFLKHLGRTWLAGLSGVIGS